MGQDSNPSITFCALMRIHLRHPDESRQEYFLFKLTISMYKLKQKHLIFEYQIDK